MADSKPKGIMARFIWSLSIAVGRHDILSLAAVISFYAFFSLFPFLLLTVYAASVFVPPYHVERVLTDLLGPYFPALPETRSLMGQNLSKLAMVGQRVGLFSALTLTWSAMSGFIAVQQAMDVVWQREQRSFFARRMISFFMVMMVLLLMLATVIVTTFAPALQNLQVAHTEPLAWLTWLQGWSRVLFPLSLFLSFFIFYRYLPSRRTPIEYVIPGAAVATVLLDVGRTIFVWYASHLIHYEMIYGGVAVVMLLMFWLYVGSIIMLFGAEVSAALERIDTEPD